MKKILLLASLAFAISAHAQQADTSQKVNQVYYSDLQRSLNNLQQIYAKIHGKSVSDALKSSTRDTLDAMLQNALVPVLQRVPQPKAPAKKGGKP